MHIKRPQLARRAAEPVCWRVIYYDYLADTLRVFLEPSFLIFNIQFYSCLSASNAHSS